jgi:toxin YoeB
MDICFAKNGWEDFEFWIDNDHDTVVRIKDLIKAIKQDPFKGIGKPEPLRYELKGYWSRTITGEHRLVYKVTGTMRY